jgi:membrane-bound metal-dependent hydrolase YbcI (DUF457 family)
LFIGHMAVAFAAKKAAPRTSLGTLFLTAGWLDLLSPLILIVGLEHFTITVGDTALTAGSFNDYPLTHSLVATLVFASLGAALYFARTRNRGAALVVAAAVLSHWVLDFATHRRGMPVWPWHGGVHIGLGLWRHPSVAIVVESAMFVGAFALYLHGTRERDRFGRWGAAAFAVFLAALFAATLASPPPPNAGVLAGVGLAGWLIPLAAWWVDRHREPVRKSA